MARSVTMPLHSQEMRKIAPEADPLRLACGWTREDLGRPWILVETTGGESMPCSYHLPDLAEKWVVRGVKASGGATARYDCTDICDGIDQGTPGMRFSLASREVIAFAVEMHVRGGHFDGMCILSGSDKGTPGVLLAAARVDIPAVFIPGGVMDVGPKGVTLEQVGSLYARLRRGEISREEYEGLALHACPTTGTCAFLGTANTNAVVAEGLGMALPTSALVPATGFELGRLAEKAGERILGMVQEDLRPSKILTREAFENAVILHSAIGGSTNTIMHLMALAYESNVDLTLRDFEEVAGDVPFLVNCRPSGEHPVNYLWYAGGTQHLIGELQDYLHMDAMTVTGRTLEENLRDVEASGYFERNRLWLRNFGLGPEEVVRPLENPIGSSSMAILYGSLAPDGAVVKVAALPPKFQRFTGRARVFDSSEEAIEAIFQGNVKPGQAVIIRYEGPAANGMPEQYYITEAIATKKELAEGVALVTDGRFSGATRGPAIGHVSPEAMAGGPIALVRSEDQVLVDIPNRRLDLLVDEDELADRRTAWRKPESKFNRGLMAVYTRLALSADKGARMDYEGAATS